MWWLAGVVVAVATAIYFLYVRSIQRVINERVAMAGEVQQHILQSHNALYLRYWPIMHLGRHSRLPQHPGIQLCSSRPSPPQSHLITSSNTSGT